MKKSTYIISAVAMTLTAAISQAQVTQQPPKPEPHMQKVLDALASLGGKPIETLTAEEARKQPTPADAVKKVLQGMDKSTEPKAGVTV